MRWLLWCFCLLAESYEIINHYHYQCKLEPWPWKTSMPPLGDAVKLEHLREEYSCFSEAISHLLLCRLIVFVNKTFGYFWKMTSSLESLIVALVESSHSVKKSSHHSIVSQHDSRRVNINYLPARLVVVATIAFPSGVTCVTQVVVSLV